MQSVLPNFSFEDSSKLTPAELLATKFVSLWHLWDFIQALAPASRQKPAWQRIADHPLEPRTLIRLWRSLDKLVGVSFGDTTAYCLLDIDIGSQYHPQSSQEAFKSLLSCLEDIGLVRPLLIQSSSSQGLHIYFPLARPVKTFALANLLVTTLKDAGFRVAPGQLETFPNIKTWKPEGQGFSHYNAHRLPLQQSSYLLDQDLNPLNPANLSTPNLEQFLSQWEQAAAGQDQESLERAIASTKIRKFTPHNQPRSRKAEEWYQESQAIIAEGFTSFGQTNDLIKKIGEFGRVFVEEIKQGGEALLQYMVNTIKNCPGYQQYCRHKHEIKKRCRQWLPLIEKWYSPYCSHPPRPRTGLTNEERSQAAQAKITAAVTELEAKDSLPPTTRKRYEAIIPYGISKETLYKYKHLWHPEHYQASVPPLPEAASAINEKTPETLEPPSNQVVRTPPLRSVAQPEVSSSNPELGLSFPRPSCCDPMTESVTSTGTPVQSLEAQTTAPALNQESSPDISSQPSLPEVQPSLEEQTEFNEWFGLAHRLGIVCVHLLPIAKDARTRLGSFTTSTD